MTTSLVEYQLDNWQNITYIIKEYHIGIENNKSTYRWIVTYTQMIDNVVKQTGMLSLYPIKECQSRRRSLQSAALFCFLFFNKGLDYSLSRELSYEYFLLL